MNTTKWTCVILVMAAFAGTAKAQTTNTWANSNVTGTPTANRDWFGANKGTWIAADPVTGNLNTIQFFQNTTTQLGNTALPSAQTVNLNNGGIAFQLGTLTLSGRGSSTVNDGADLTMSLSGDALNFSAATGTVNLNAMLEGNRAITYNVGHNIQLGTASTATALTFTGNGTAAFNFNGNITSQTGTSTVTKSGSSALTLGGINTFNGLTLSGGTLLAGNNSTSSGNDNFGVAGITIYVTGNSTISYLSSALTFSFNKAIDIASGVTLTFTKGGGGSHTYQGVLSGGNNTTVAVNDANTIEARTLVFSNTANTFTGNIDLSASNSTISFNSLSDASGAGNIKFGSNANRSSAFQFGSGAIAPLVLNNRRIEIIAGGSAGGTASIYNNAAHTLTINSDLLVTGTGGTKTLELRGSNGGNNTFAGIISNGGLTTLSLNKADAGTWLLGNTNNTYTGSTTISGGTLEVANLVNGGVNSPIGTSSSAASNLKLGGGASLRYTGSGDSTDRNFTINQTAHDQKFILDASGTGPINFTSTASPVYSASNYRAIVTLSGTSTANNTFAAIVTNNGALTVQLQKDGIGTWVLINESTCTGGIIIKGGGTLVLDYSTPGSKLLDTATLTLNGGTLLLRGGSEVEVVTGTTYISGGATFITRDSGSSVLSMGEFNNNRGIGGSISFLDGTVARTTTPNNTFGMFGAWATVGNNFACNDGSGNIVAFSGATTALPTTGTGGSVNYTLTGGQNQTGSSTLAVSTLKITGTGGTDNTLALGATNIRCQHNANYLAGGILYTGGGTGVFNITADAGKGIDVTNVNRDLIINTFSGTLKVSAALQQSQTSGNLLKTGAGTLEVSSANAYTGPTYVNEGTLRLANATAAGTVAGGIQVQNNAALELIGSVNIGAEALTITGAGISNGGALRNVSGNNTYGGTITLANLGGARINSDSGSLALTNASAIVTAVFRDVTIGGEGNTTVSGLISGAGSLIKDGTGTLTLSGTNTYSGTTTINGGKLALGGHNVLSGKSVTINNNSTLDAGTYTNTLSTLKVSGSGTIVMSPGAVLAFADSRAIQWGGTLNLSGVFAAGTSLRFGTSSASLTTEQIASLKVTGYTLALDANGYLTGRPSGTLIYFM